MTKNEFHSRKEFEPAEKENLLLEFYKQVAFSGRPAIKNRYT